MKRLSLSILTFFVIILIAALPVYAASYHLAPTSPDIRNKETFSLLRYSLEPNQTVATEIDAVNTQNKPVKVYLFSQNQAVEVLTVKTPLEPITIPPISRVTIPFEVKTLKNAKKGEYALRIYLDTRKNARYQQGKSPSLKLVVTLGKNLVKRLEVNRAVFQLNSKSLTAHIGVKNTGTATIDDIGFKLNVKNNTPLISSTKEYFFGETFNLLPGKSAVFVYKIPDASSVLFNGVGMVSVDYSGKHIASKTSQINYVNYAVLSFYIGIGCVVFGLLFFLGRSKNLNTFLTLPVNLLQKLLHIALGLFRKMVRLKLLLNPHKPPVTEHVSIPPEKPRESVIPHVGLDGLVKNIMKEEENIIVASNVSYDKILFEVRKIVRQEIELWKEMEQFREQVREQLTREADIKKRLEEELNKTTHKVKN